MTVSIWKISHELVSGSLFENGTSTEHECFLTILDTIQIPSAFVLDLSCLKNVLSPLYFRCHCAEHWAAFEITNLWQQAFKYGNIISCYIQLVIFSWGSGILTGALMISLLKRFILKQTFFFMASFSQRKQYLGCYCCSEPQFMLINFVFSWLAGNILKLLNMLITSLIILSKEKQICLHKIDVPCFAGSRCTC